MFVHCSYKNRHKRFSGMCQLFVVRRMSHIKLYYLSHCFPHENIIIRCFAIHIPKTHIERFDKNKGTDKDKADESSARAH